MKRLHTLPKSVAMQCKRVSGKVYKAISGLEISGMEMESISEISTCHFTLLTYNWSFVFIIVNGISFCCSRINKLTSCTVHVLHAGSYDRAVVFTHLNQSAKHKNHRLESCLSLSPLKSRMFLRISSSFQDMGESGGSQPDHAPPATHPQRCR